MESAAKEAAAEHTKQWLRLTFVKKEGSTVSREEAYEAYLDECKANNHEPTNRAALGKLFTQQFGKLAARRLGNRQKNKMHYKDLEWRRNLDPNDDATQEGCDQPIIPAEPRAHTWVMEPLCLASAPLQPPLSSSSPPSWSSATQAEGRVEVIVIDGEASAPARRQTSHSGKRKKAQAMPTRRADEHADSHRNLAPMTVIEVLSSPTLCDPVVEHEGWLWERRTGVQQLRPENEEERTRENATERRRSRRRPRSPSHHPEQQGMSDLLQYIAERHRKPVWESHHGRHLVIQRDYVTYHHRLVSQSLLSDAHLAKMRIITDCSVTYKREMWNIVPMNPACIDDSSLTQLFNAPHDDCPDAQSLSTYIMLTMSAFINGQISTSREFFYKAREHLGYLFDETSYDVAAALVPLSWWARFYSISAAQGEQKQVYYATIGQKICEAIGAINDATYMGFIQLASIQGMTSPLERMAEASKQPAYEKKNWRFAASDLEPPHHNPDLILHSDMCNIHGVFLQHFNHCMTGPGVTKESQLALLRLLAQTDNIIRTLRRKKLANESTLPQQTFNMILSLALSVRAVTHMVLQLRGQSGAAKDLLEHMVGLSKPLMIICLHELASNDFLLIRHTIEILAEYRDSAGYGLLKSLQRKLEDHRDFYWIARTYDLVDAAIHRIQSARELAHRSRHASRTSAGSFTVGANRVETHPPPSATSASEVHQGYGAGVVEVTNAYAQWSEPRLAPGAATLPSPTTASRQSAAPPSVDEELASQLELEELFSASSQLPNAVLPEYGEEQLDGDLGAVGPQTMCESAGGTSTACDEPEGEQEASSSSTMPPLHPDLEYQPLGADVPLPTLGLDESEGQYPPGDDM